MTDTDANVHVLRPTPAFAFIVSTIVFAGIALPGLFFDPLHYITGAGSAILVICGSAWFAIFALYRSHVVCTYDASEHVIRIARIRWPLQTTEVTVPIDAISAVNLEQRTQAWCVTLSMSDGTKVPLTHFFSGSSAHARARDALEAWVLAHRASPEAGGSA